MLGIWYNIDVAWLSVCRESISLKETKENKIDENSIIEKYVFSDDASFINHYKLEDNGISCIKPLENRFEIYEKVKRYKNVLEEYDKGKRNHMLQIKLETNTINGGNEKSNKVIEDKNIDNNIGKY